MDPSSGEKSGPQFEAPQGSEGLEQQHDKAMERAPDGESAIGKKTPKQLNTAVLQLPTDIPTAAPVAIPSDQPAGRPPAAEPPQTAARDSHQIEKQWVDKAKKIIAQTKDDPKTQKHQMSQVKAEYIQKRFNKTIPTEGTASP